MFEIGDLNQRVCAQLSKASRSVLLTSPTSHGETKKAAKLRAKRHVPSGFRERSTSRLYFLSFFAHCTCIIIHIKSVFLLFQSLIE